MKEPLYSTCELITAIRKSNLPEQIKNEVLEFIEQWAEENL